MRLLVLYQARDAAADHPGYYDGFERLVAEGRLASHISIPFLCFSAAQGWDALWTQAYETAKDNESDAIFLHFFHGGVIPDPGAGIRRLRSLPNRPTIFTSAGDGFGRITKRLPRSLRVASALSDLSFVTSMGRLSRQLLASGSRNVVLMPHGCCQVRFSGRPCLKSNYPEFDIAFIGNHIRSLNPLRLGRARSKAVAAMTKRYGRRFGLFGNGWAGNSSWQGPCLFREQHAAYSRAAIAWGGLPHISDDFYLSDRPFIAIASGVSFVDHPIPGVDRILEPARDWWLAEDLQNLFKVCDRLLEMPAGERIRLGGEARTRILHAHTQYHRCAEMVGIVKEVRTARLRGRQAARPQLKFLSDSAGSRPAPEPIDGWVG